ncbi:MAG: DNA translocase FtsK [Puniceicoccaceae bacterium]|nr:DNA translocase FtsK [Puniceicoccaceae bacterium]
MARRFTKKSTQKKTSNRQVAPAHPLWALVLFTLAVLALVAIGDFDVSQSTYKTTNAVPGDNLVGVFGANFSFVSFLYIGVATWLLPAYLMWFGVRLLLQQSPKKRTATALMSVISIVCVSGLLAMFELLGFASAESSIFKDQLYDRGFGGLIGYLLTEPFLQSYIGSFGTIMVLLMGLIIGSLITFTDNVGHFLEYLHSANRSVLVKLREYVESLKQAWAKKAKLRREIKLEKYRLREEAKVALALEKKEAEEARLEPTLVDEGTSLLDAPISGNLEQNAGRIQPPPIKPKKLVTQQEQAVSQSEQAEMKKPKFDLSMIKVVSEEKTEKALATIPERRGDYTFPPISLLAEAPNADGRSPQDHAGTMEALVRTLEEFGVKVNPGEIHTGPVITRYEVTPAAGVRVEKIVNLDKNIALGLKAESVRILAPVPGKGTVGIEVPNRIAQAVCMRDIVESKSWAEAKAEIPIVLGKDVTGKPMVTDLTKMPHVLIAGSTGSGKTVCINAIIASLLYHSGPEDLRFIMVDPKVVEMQMYNALPHMLIPVVTEPKKVPGALKWLLAEMERRYQIFAAENVRNVAGFNAKIAKTKEEKEKAAAMDAEMTAEERAAVTQVEVPRDDDAFEIPRKKLPYIVCVIDELADLMMVAPADIETGIARLAQLARAAGIHLILATQRPSVNVITGVIKANLPSRISFKVASKVDSRTILDGGGAEALIGKGDMLFIPPGTSSLVRAQGAFVSDDEINGIVEYLKEHNEPPVFAESVQQQIDAGGDDNAPTAGTGESDDELLPQAIDVLRATKRASTSMLQRRLRIGYNRAARLMEELEDRGIVGPENGSSPREILVDLDTM